MHIRSRWLLPWFLAGITAAAQQSGSAPQPAAAPAPLPAHHACTVFHDTVENHTLLHTEKEIDALQAKVLKGQPDPILVDRVVDSEMAQHDIQKALVRAQILSDVFPASSEAMVELAEVKMRMGDLDDVIDLVNHAIKLDTCNPWPHFEAGLYLELDGMYAQSRAQFKLAHLLSPDNNVISRHWERVNPPTKTPEEIVAQLKEELAKPNLTEEQKDGINFALKAMATQQRGDCTVVNPIATMTTKMMPMSGGLINNPNDVYGLGLEVSLNGNKRRLLLDTGAPGLTLSHATAVAAGLTPEFEVKSRGFGDGDGAPTYITHVDDIKIGSLEFKNCIVSVLEQSKTIHIDGFIGADVFKDYLVTLDFPEHELRLSPLPPRPGDTPGQASLSTAGLSEDTLAQRQDRYVAPEMKDWTQIFRRGHNLIVPTSIGNAPTKLFVLDSGSDRGLISPEAAQLVTKVKKDESESYSGLSGQVKKLQTADNVTIIFAGVRQTTEKMTSLDLTSFSRSVGVEISGFIGFPTLRQITLAIDYRDNMIHVTHDPMHDGFH